MVKYHWIWDYNYFETHIWHGGMDVPEAFSAEQLWQEQWPSTLLPPACSQYCHPACENTLLRSLERGFVPPTPACLCTRNGAENCLFVPQKDGGPCLGDWMFMILSLWERTLPISRDHQAVLMLPATSTVSWKQISVRKVIMELFNRSPHMSLASKKPIRLCCLLP